ncbi:MAG: hypothetical protein AAF203_00905 [Pseudomonadota bacterium]
MKMGIVLFLCSIGISVVLLNPTVRKRVSSLFLPIEREVLSQLEMEREGQVYKVIKIQNRSGLAVELYKKDGDGFMFLDGHQLTDKKDASYKFENNNHNLFLKDINNDGVSEIILPSVDKNMKARLNVFMFDPENETLQKVTKH